MYKFTIYLNFTRTDKTYSYDTKRVKVTRLRPTKKTTQVKHAKIILNEHGILV